MQIGENLRKYRIERAMERITLAEALGVEEGYIERIENLEIQPQVSDLLRLAAALKTDISALIYGKEFFEKGVTVTTSDERVKIERARYLGYESLAPYYSGRHMEPFVVEIGERDPDLLEFNQHAGEEFHYVLEGILRIVVEREEHVLEVGDSIYFDSSLPHAVSALAGTGTAKTLATIYNGETMLQMTRGHRMRNLIQAAKLVGQQNVAVVRPDFASIEAVNRGMEEGIIGKACLFGRRQDVPHSILRYSERYEWVELDSKGEHNDEAAAAAAVKAAGEGKFQMLMKGRVNTAVFVKAILDNKGGINTERRLSLVSIFELPDVDRLIFLTDPGINPELMHGDDLQTSVDIICNAIDVARSMGVSVPKVALMDANEVPSPHLPSTMYEKKLSDMKWENAVVYGPVSYDLALYEKAVRKKGSLNTPVHGKADILVVPYISAGNFLYKAWAMTMDAEVANVVIGAKVPIILTSRSDSDMVKFLTICASAIYSRYLVSKT